MLVKYLALQALVLLILLTLFTTHRQGASSTPSRTRGCDVPATRMEEYSHSITKGVNNLLEKQQIADLRKVHALSWLIQGRRFLASILCPWEGLLQDKSYIQELLSNSSLNLKTRSWLCFSPVTRRRTTFGGFFFIPPSINVEPHMGDFT